MDNEPRQLSLTRKIGPPLTIPSEDFVTVDHSIVDGEKRANGYFIISTAMTRKCPWVLPEQEAAFASANPNLADHARWHALRQITEMADLKLVVLPDEDSGRVLICLTQSKRGTHDFGAMPGYISQNPLVTELYKRGLIPGRQPARWEEHVLHPFPAWGNPMPGWTLVVYLRRL
jgi:hypothetical protein